MLISGSFPPMKCGVGDYTAKLAQALAQNADTSVAVLADVTASETDVTSPRLQLFPIAHGWTFSDLPAILRTARQWRPEIIHIQYPGQGYKSNMPYLMPTFFMLLGIPSVQTWHNYYERVRRWHYLPNALLPGGLVVVRPEYKARMPHWFRRLIAHKHFRFIPNASALPRVELSAAERAAIRARFGSSDRRLIVYVGFVFRPKGVELLFEIADPARDHIVIIGEINPTDKYHQELLNRAQREPWANHATTTGFLPPDEAARILAAADTVALPYHEGGGMWNTSIQGAAIQGTFVLTTSFERHGFDATQNIYYAHPDDVEEMRQALEIYNGRKSSEDVTKQFATWEKIAEAHLELYRSVKR
jgi:glycosyltransferase involved in cell wall biosynthesis